MLECNSECFVRSGLFENLECWSCLACLGSKQHFEVVEMNNCLCVGDWPVECSENGERMSHFVDGKFGRKCGETVGLFEEA